MEDLNYVNTNNTNNTGGSSSSSKFRSAKKLQDEYSFQKESDAIGSGAFSVVYRATPVSAAALAAVAGLQQHLQQQSSSSRSQVPSQPPPPAYVALKVISRRDVITEAESRQQRREVEREVGVLQKLSHTGCTVVIETLQTSEEYAIVMQLLEGCMDAGKYLRTFGALMEEHAALVVFQLLHTVKFLHRTFGLLHRDIKVENLILSPPLPPPQTSTTSIATAPGGASTHHNHHHVGSSSGQAGGAVAATSMLPSTPSLEDVLAGGSDDERISGSGGTGAATSVLLGCDANKKGHHHHSPAASMSSPPLATPLLTSPSPSAARGSPIADSVAVKHIRCYGRVTLVDFGLARWLPALSPSTSLERPQSPTPPGASPVSPNPIARVHSFTSGGAEVMFPPAPSTTDQQHQHAVAQYQQQLIHLSCCGSDKYMAPEMLKWYLEHLSSAPSSLSSAHYQLQQQQQQSMPGGAAASQLLFAFRSSQSPQAALQQAAPAAVLPPAAASHHNHRKQVSIGHAMKMDVYSVGVVAYALLSGCLPYNGKTRAAVAAQHQTSGALRMNSQHWAGVSAEAKRFVSRLLVTDVVERCTVEEALDDVWLASPAAVCSKLHILPEPAAGALPQSSSFINTKTPGSIAATAASLTTATTGTLVASGKTSSPTVSPLHSNGNTAMLSVVLSSSGGGGRSNSVASAGGGGVSAPTNGSGVPALLLDGAGDLLSMASGGVSPHHHSHTHQHHTHENHQLHLLRSTSSSRNSNCESNSSPCLPSTHHVGDDEGTVVSFSKSSLR